jgi:hypothetical protein
MNHELQNIISGTQQVSYGAIIQTVLNYLRRCQKTSRLAQTDKYYKSEETKNLVDFINQQDLWVNDINTDFYISEGAEQKVYLKDEKSVWKLNDAIYYTSWQDYFINLLLNNYFFTDTAYDLKGFYKEDSTLYAVVVQSFVKANKKTDLLQVKAFMMANGFVNTRNNDYFNPELGIILEDLHDENVLTQDDVLYFIDTVFYLKI